MTAKEAKAKLAEAKQIIAELYAYRIAFRSEFRNERLEEIAKWIKENPV